VELTAILRTALATLAGLAPINADNGLKRRQRRIRGGRRRVRQALYMAAVSTLRANNSFKTTYAKLRNVGNAAPPFPARPLGSDFGCPTSLSARL
jgi:transposase